jgi:hypothetical protein
MPANYVLLERITLTANAASVVLDNIPQTGYTDLVLKVSARGTPSTAYASYGIKLNATTTNYSLQQLYGSGSSTVASAATPAYIPTDAVGATATANTFSNTEIYIPNYASSANKSLSIDTVTENNATEAYAELYAGRWANSASVTSITLEMLASGSFVIGSSFSLYGVAALGTTPVIAPKASGGDIVISDGTYWYHAFLASGVFTPSQTLSCDVLAVAGGGGGGGGTFVNGNGGGGGGAGGLINLVSQSLLATPATVLVGAGGAGGVNALQGAGLNGTNSQLASLTASVGGGGGGAEAFLNNGFNGRGSNGGSGGGNSENRSVATGTVGQGNNGGQTGGSAGAGGGGAGAVGGDTVGSDPGPGGAGLNTYSSWLSATGTGVSGFIAGGGGGGKYNAGAGGAGGSGGGGTGASGGDSNNTAGTANTGGGGGGSSNQGAVRVGRAGGSGIVIVRYTVA